MAKKQRSDTVKSMRIPIALLDVARKAAAKQQTTLNAVLVNAIGKDLVGSDWENEKPRQWRRQEK